MTITQTDIILICVSLAIALIMCLPIFIAIIVCGICKLNRQNQQNQLIRLLYTDLFENNENQNTETQI